MACGTGRALASLLSLLAVTISVPRHAGADVTSTLVLSAQVHGRTRLVVSTRTLRFTIVNPDEPALATLDFVASARTRRDSDVVLTVETQGGVRGPGGAADVAAELLFEGDGPGTLSGALAAGAPAVAARWTGSGRRAGRLGFSLRAGAEGDYIVAVHLVLSAP